MYKCKYSRLRVAHKIRQMAKELKKQHVINDNAVFLVMLSGGVWFSHTLFDRLGDICNEVYYIKGHSYKGKVRESFVWDLLPKVDLSGRDVIIIDDICDSGETMKAVCKELKDRVKSIVGVTLLKRVPCTVEIGMPVYACIEDNTKDFFVGCGLDDNGKGRLLQHVAVC